MTNHRCSLPFLVALACSLLLSAPGDLTRPTLVAASVSEPGEISEMAAPRRIDIGAFGDVLDFESLSGRHVRSVLWYEGWDATDQLAFPADDLAANVRDHDGFDTQTIVHLTWEPWVNLVDITSGLYDAYITQYAGDAREWGEPIRLRFAHEMIQDGTPDHCFGQTGCAEWYPWQDQPEAYVAAYRHVWGIFGEAGASNVEFVWCPNNWPFDVDIVRQYYPGQEYVDWLCSDGYNWTNQDGVAGWPDWQWFDDIYYPIYHTLVDHPEIFGDAPMMIGEFASCEAGPHEQAGQTKSAWTANAFSRITSADYNRIAAVYWFNTNKECDWRINSSAASLAAFREAVAGAPFVSHPLPTRYLPLVR